MRARCRLPILLLALLLGTPAAVPAQEESWEDTISTAEDDSLPVIDDTVIEEIAPAIDSISARLLYDSSQVTVRRPADGTIARYLDDEEFLYDRKPRDPETLWERFKRWLEDLISSLMPEGAARTFWDWAAWIVVGIAVIVVIMNMRGVRGIFLRKPDRNVSDFVEIDENIDAMDFNALLDEALSQGNYRRGVRLLYLKSLKDLADRGLIAFRKEKTNQDYIRELRAADLHESFRYVTALFEYVWYGDAPVNESIFGSVRERFADFTSNLARHREAL